MNWRLLLICLFWCGAAVAEEIPAEIGWLDERPLGTPLNGVVWEVKVAPGSRVPAGGLLVRLDDRVFRARFEEAQAALAQAEEDRAEAQRELERSEELYDRTLLSEHDLQLAHIARKKAEAAYHAARTRWESARFELDYAAIRAPFDAVVLEVRVAPGEAVANAMQARPLVVVARAEGRAARGRVGAELATGLAPGRKVVVMAGGRRYRAELQRVALKPDAKGGFVVEAAIEDGQGLAPGTPARIVIE